MSMLSTLDALEAAEGASAPRAGVFQPKVKARVRKGGGRGDGGASAAVKPPPTAPVAAKPSPLPVATTFDLLEPDSSTAEKAEVSQSCVEAADVLMPKEGHSAPGLSNEIAPECAPEEVPKVASPGRSEPVEPAPANESTPAVEADSLVDETTVAAATTQESQFKYTQESCVTTREFSQPVAVRSSFPIPSSFASTEVEEGVQGNVFPRAEGPPSDLRGDQEGERTGLAEPARRTKLKNSARKNRKQSSTPAASDIPSTSAKEAVDGILDETTVTLDDELIANRAVQEEHDVTASRKRKRAFSHSTSRAKGQKQDGGDSKRVSQSRKLDCDLSNPSSLPLREVIRRAENIERKKAKEEMAKKSLSDISKPKERDAVREPEPQRDVLSLAPQVQVVNGRIVVNEQTLTVGAYATSAQDTEQYTRVEEKASRLNYHTYSNRTVTERWKPEETDLFYKAIRQFGTDFDLIINLFPTRTRRQIKAKYKKEETVNPRRVADALTYRPKDQSHYEEMLARMNRDDLIQETSDPFASILAYRVQKPEEKSELQEKAEVDDTEPEEIIAGLVL